MTMDKTTAVLLDVTSIQGYVFGSNKLRENLGASKLVEKAYNDHLKQALSDLGIVNIDLKQFSREPEKIAFSESDSPGVEIGYIGGGNALLLFREPEKAEKFVEAWTRILLWEAPGLQSAAVIEPSFNPSLKNEEFIKQMELLHKKLAANKNSYHRQTVIPRHGFTAECKRTGLSMEAKFMITKENGDREIQQFISGVSRAKEDAIKKDSADDNKTFESESGDVFLFPSQLEELGQKIGESYIAVVHIDGNSMGDRFSKCKSLPELRRLSSDVENAVKSSFEKMLNDFVPFISESYFNEHFQLCRKDGEVFLPIRKIIEGGDDVTFVCDGRLGIFFAERFMRHFADSKGLDGKLLSLSSCAGVSIVKTRYPFYRAYMLAEELCSSAKKRARNIDETGNSWLDFHLSYGGMSGGLEQIRRENYIVKRGGKSGNLLLRPYRASGFSLLRDKNDFAGIKKACIEMNEEDNKWPRNKIYEMRKTLSLDEAACKTFLHQIKARGLRIPEVADFEILRSGNTDLWKPLSENLHETPYFDIIELLSLYPTELMEYSQEMDEKSEKVVAGS